MKKFKLQFSSQSGAGNYNEVKIIQAESCEAAVQQFIEASKNTQSQYVLASGYGFLHSEGFHLNHYYIQPKNIQLPKPTIIESNTEDKTACANNIQVEKLDKLIEIQENQLHWIRFLGVVTLISLITAFVYILIAVSSGRPRY